MRAVTSPKYFLKSERLGFRWWTKEDLPLARELWGDLKVTKFFGGPFTEEEIAGRLERELEHAREHQFQYWPIHWLADDDFAGCCGLRPFKPEEGILELGFHLRPKYWGRGLAGEAARVAIARNMKRHGKLWIRIFPQKSFTKKPLETRMGKGKGPLESWVAVIRPANVLFEVDGVTEAVARESLRLAATKLPIKTKFISRHRLG